jgi:DNA-binding SARP family transcriptional activator
VYQLMVALSRSGRRSDALAQYRLARDRLREQHGTEPSPVLRDLQQRLLRDSQAGSPPSLWRQHQLNSSRVGVSTTG